MPRRKPRPARRTDAPSERPLGDVFGRTEPGPGDEMYVVRTIPGTRAVKTSSRWSSATVTSVAVANEVSVVIRRSSPSPVRRCKGTAKPRWSGPGVTAGR